MNTETEAEKLARQAAFRKAYICGHIWCVKTRLCEKSGIAQEITQ